MIITIRTKMDLEIKDQLDKFLVDDLKNGKFRDEMITGELYFQINGKYIDGINLEQPVNIGGWIFCNLRSLLESIASVSNGEKKEVHMIDSSVVIIIEPINETTINITSIGGFSGSTKLKGFTVSKKEYAEAVIEAAENVLHELLLHFPKIKNAHDIITFEKALTEAKKVYETIKDKN